MPCIHGHYAVKINIPLKDWFKPLKDRGLHHNFAASFISLLTGTTVQDLCLR